MEITRKKKPGKDIVRKKQLYLVLVIFSFVSVSQLCSRSPPSVSGFVAAGHFSSRYRVKMDGGNCYRLSEICCNVMTSWTSETLLKGICIVFV